MGSPVILVSHLDQRDKYPGHAALADLTKEIKFTAYFFKCKTEYMFDMIYAL